MQVDVQAFVGLHLEGHLHTRLGEHLLRGIVGQLIVIIPATDSAQARGVVGIFLGVVVSGNPPGRMVPGHRILRKFVLNHKIGKAVLPRELVAEAQAIVKAAEADDHCFAHILFEGDGQLVIVVADAGFFSPDRFPGLVKGRTFFLLQGKTVIEAHGSTICLDGLLFKSIFETGAAKFYAQAGGQDHIRLPAFERIHRDAVHDGHLQFQLPVRALNLEGVFRKGRDRPGPAGGKGQDRK